MNILLIGQTPPPYGGQAMMIKRTLEGKYSGKIKFHHIRMSFSREMDEIGKIQLRKIILLFSIVFQAYVYRIKYRTNVLYYFPAGPNTVPIIRDAIILALLKPLFFKKIFHFRAGGISTLFENKSNLLTKIVKNIYGKPEIGIRLSEFAPRDDLFFNSKKNAVLYNGIEDQQKYLDNSSVNKRIDNYNTDTISFCYLGILKESKGLLDLIDSFKHLTSNQIEIKVTLIGKVESKEFREQIEKHINEIDKSNVQFEFTGVLTGKKKIEKVYRSDIFLFPSYFESEGLPGSIIEAMSLEKPIIATKWRGIPSLVSNGENGFLVDTHSPEQVAEAIEKYIGNRELVPIHGKKSREMFLSRFTLERYYENLESIFNQLK
jgi:glycosyltransferase involved in cell wall biosynthesis